LRPGLTPLTLSTTSRPPARIRERRAPRSKRANLRRLDAIRQLMIPPEPKRKKPIGYHTEKN
jgi:hypothetical protein